MIKEVSVQEQIRAEIRKSVTVSEILFKKPSFW